MPRPGITKRQDTLLMFGILKKIRLLEHFSLKSRKHADSSRASLFGEQSIASLPKKRCFPPNEVLLSSRTVVFLYKTKQKSVLNFLFLSKRLIFGSLSIAEMFFYA